MPDGNTPQIPLDLLDTTDNTALQAFVDGFDPTDVEGLSETSRRALSNGQAPLVKQFALQEAASHILEHRRQQAVESHPELIKALGQASVMRVPLEIPASLDQLRALEAALTEFDSVVDRYEGNLATEALRRKFFDEPTADVIHLVEKLHKDKQRLCRSPLPIDASNRVRSRLETVLQGIQSQLADADNLVSALERRRQESLAAHGRTIQSTMSGRSLMLMLAEVTSATPLSDRDLLSSALDGLDQVLATNQKFADIENRLAELRERYPMSHRRIKGRYKHLLNDPLDDQIEYLLSNRHARTRAAAINNILDQIDEIEAQLRELDQKLAEEILKVQPRLDEAVLAYQEIMEHHSHRISGEYKSHTKDTLEMGPQAMFESMVSNGFDPQEAAQRIRDMMVIKLDKYRELAEREIQQVDQVVPTGAPKRRPRTAKQRERSQRDRDETAKRKGPSPGAAKFGPGKQRRKK